MTSKYKKMFTIINNILSCKHKLTKVQELLQKIPDIYLAKYLEENCIIHPLLTSISVAHLASCIQELSPKQSYHVVNKCILNLSYINKVVLSLEHLSFSRRIYLLKRCEKILLVRYLYNLPFEKAAEVVKQLDTNTLRNTVKYLLLVGSIDNNSSENLNYFILLVKLLNEDADLAGEAGQGFASQREANKLIIILKSICRTSELIPYLGEFIANTINVYPRLAEQLSTRLFQTTPELLLEVIKPVHYHHYCYIQQLQYIIANVSFRSIVSHLALYYHHRRKQLIDDEPEANTKLDELTFHLLKAFLSKSAIEVEKYMNEIKPGQVIKLTNLLSEKNSQLLLSLLSLEKIVQVFQAGTLNDKIILLTCIPPSSNIISSLVWKLKPMSYKSREFFKYFKELYLDKFKHMLDNIDPSLALQIINLYFPIEERLELILQHHTSPPSQEPSKILTFICQQKSPLKILNPIFSNCPLKRFISCIERLLSCSLSIGSYNYDDSSNIVELELVLSSLHPIVKTVLETTIRKIISSFPEKKDCCVCFEECKSKTICCNQPICLACKVFLEKCPLCRKLNFECLFIDNLSVILKIIDSTNTYT